MRILAINGSPRGAQGNTEAMLQPFLEGARAFGAETEVVFPCGRPVRIVIAVVTSAGRRHIHLQVLAHFLKMIESTSFKTEWFLEQEEKELKKNVLSFMINKEFGTLGEND